MQNINVYFLIVHCPSTSLKLAS